MPLIKRYPNRKLYDTKAKRYITLDGVAELIRQGEEVQVVDHTTDEDLTAVTLTQIIFEQEKKRSGFLPTSVLTGLVKAGGDTIGHLRRGLSSPLDLLRQVDEEIEKRLQDLVNRGELAGDEGARLRKKLLGRGPSLGQVDLEEFIHNRGIPTRDEIRQLNDKLEAVARQLERIAQEMDSD